MIIYRADTNNNETLIKSLNGNKVLTFYVKVDSINKKDNKDNNQFNLKPFFNFLEKSIKVLPKIS